ncbi:MAG: ATPase [Sphingomonadales bacterium]|nr:ATPase [Sphingomonadales bacterium]
MKRFYRAATVAPTAHGFGVLLDGKPVNTPSRRPLEVPTRAIAIGIAKEWNDQGEEIDLRAMGLTGLANSAIDRLGDDRAGFIDTLAAYGATDLLYYRADAPDALAGEQAAAWNPILDWFEREHGESFVITRGIVPVVQPPATLAALRVALEEHGDFSLAALHPLVTIGGSLVTALALAAGELSSDQAWQAVTIDEAWQERHWGVDDEAHRTLALKRAEWDRAVALLAMLA